MNENNKLTIRINDGRYFKVGNYPAIQSRGWLKGHKSGEKNERENSCIKVFKFAVI